MSTNQIRMILFQNLAPFLDDKDMMMEINSFILKLSEQKNVATDLPNCYSKKEVMALSVQRAEELMSGKVSGIDNEEVFKQLRSIL